MNISRTLLCLLTGLVCSADAAAQDNDPLFESPWRAFGTGNFPTFAPWGMDHGDIDGDGDPDVVTARDFFGGPGLSVLRNNGDGTYAQPTLLNLPFNYNLREVKLVDISGDGSLDIIATIPNGHGQYNRIGYWRNNGDGTFASRVEFTTGIGPTGLEVGDFNGDGRPDVVVTNYGPVASQANTISFLPHNGQNGTSAGFLSQSTTVISGQKPDRVEAADIDSDGDLDLAVMASGYTGVSPMVVVLTNDGQGQFTETNTFEPAPQASNNSRAIELVDVNGDGAPDLLSTGAVNASVPWGMVFVRLNNGDGTFGTSSSYQLAPGTWLPHHLEVADVSGDGRMDILATTPSGRANDGWCFLRGTANGFEGGERYQAAKQTFDIASFDADGDGDRDVMTVANDSSVLTVHTNRGAGDFFVPAFFPTGALATGQDAADLDGDGDIDIVHTASQLKVLLNNGDATFAPVQSYQAPFLPGKVVLRDMNNDGFPDAVIGGNRNAPPYGFAVMLNNGDGSFAPGVAYYPGACQAGEVEAFDLDNDGDLDVVLTEETGACGNSRIFLARNNGNGQNFTIMQPITAFAIPFGIGGADLDHDGNIDLVSAMGGAIGIYLGNGDFTFSPDPLFAPDEGYPFHLTDLNGDGDHDLVYIVPQDSFGLVEIGVMRGYGDGGFAFPTYYDGPNGREGAFQIAADITTADVNGDMHQDVIVASNAPNDVSIYLGNGDMTLQQQDRYGVGYQPRFCSPADFDGDGRIDLGLDIALPPSGIGDAVVIIRSIVGDPGNQPEPATLLNAQVVFGSLLFGDVNELTESDDARMRTRSNFGFSALEPNLMELVLDFETDIVDASLLELAIETRINHPTGTAKIRLRNWQTNSFQQVVTHPLTFTETMYELNDIDASNRVRASDGRVQVSIRHIVAAVFSAQGFDSEFDLTSLNVR